MQLELQIRHFTCLLFRLVFQLATQVVRLALKLFEFGQFFLPLPLPPLFSRLVHVFFLRQVAGFHGRGGPLQRIHFLLDVCYLRV